MDWGPCSRRLLVEEILTVLNAAEAFVAAGQEEGTFVKMDAKQVIVTLIGCTSCRSPWGRWWRAS